MQINLDPNFGPYYIRSYKPGEFRINDQVVLRSVILTPEQLIEWPPQKFSELTTEYLKTLLEFKPEIVLLGTGSKQFFLQPESSMLFYQQHVGIEVMDTLAACRTYNVLISEARNVVAGLLVW